MLQMGRGAQPFLGSWSLTNLYVCPSLSNPQLSLSPFKFPSPLSLFLSASDDDAQSGFRKLRQKFCSFCSLALYLHNAIKHLVISINLKDEFILVPVVLIVKKWQIKL